MEFIQQNNVGVGKARVVLQSSQQYTFGSNNELCFFGNLGVESHLITNSLPDATAVLPCNPLANGFCGDAPRLKQIDSLRGSKRHVHERRRNASRLT